MIIFIYFFNIVTALNTLKITRINLELKEYVFFEKYRHSFDKFAEYGPLLFWILYSSAHEKSKISNNDMVFYFFTTIVLVIEGIFFKNKKYTRQNIDPKWYFDRKHEINQELRAITTEEVFLSIKNPKIVATQISVRHCLGEKLKNPPDEIIQKLIKIFITDYVEMWPNIFIVGGTKFSWLKVVKQNDIIKNIITPGQLQLSNKAKKYLNLKQYQDLKILNKPKHVIFFYQVYFNLIYFFIYVVFLFIPLQSGVVKTSSNVKQSNVSIN